MIKQNYKIIKLDYKTAMEIVVQKHYLHRKAPCSFAFGLVDGGNEIVGVITYGTPAAAGIRKGICGIEEKDNVIELTRLWIDDKVGKNAESFLIGNTVRKVNKQIIVSFAEGERGHVGTVYQATNFLYTGLSAKRTNWKVEGISVHNHTLTDKYSAVQMKEMYGDAFKLVDRPRKHRYVYFNCSKTRKKQLVKKLKYPLQQYPKK